EDVDESVPSTIEDNKEISLLESFNYYLKKDQINDESLDIDDLKITKYLNKIIELRNTLYSEINDLQRKNLVDLFNYTQHFIKEFNELLKKNDLDHTLLKKMRTTAINLGLSYVHLRNVIIGDETFGKVINEKNKNWIIIFIFFLKNKF
ncbi:15148_t:CDS:1, partial [Dentiscutata heterogama]